MSRILRRALRPGLEGLEGRRVMTSAFFVGGEAASVFAGGATGAEILRVDPASGSTTILTQFLKSVGSATQPVLSRLEGLALEPSGSLIAVGPAATGAGVAGELDVYRVRADTGAFTLLSRFGNIGLNAAPLLNRVDDVAVGPNGDIYVAGAAAVGNAGLTAPRVVKVNPTTGAQAVLTTFTTSFNFSTLATLDRIDGIAVAPDGSVLTVGFGVEAGLNGARVARVTRINPTTGAQAVVGRFPAGSLGPPPFFVETSGIAVQPDGLIRVSGTGVDLATGSKVGRVAAVNPTTGALSILTSFAVAGPGSPVLNAANAVAFAPVASTLLVGGVKSSLVIGTTVRLNVPRLIKVNPATGAPLAFAQFDVGIPGPLLRLSAVAAGPTLDNLIPEVAIKGPSAARAGRAVAFRLKVPKAHPLARFTYRIDWDGDGTIDQTVTDARRRVAVRHAFTEPGVTRPVVSVVTASGVSSAFVAGRVRIRGN